MTIGDKPMLLSPDKAKPRKEGKALPREKRRRGKPLSEPDADKERYRLDVGHIHGVKPGNIVGAIANEAGLDGEHIGHIEIETEYSLVDLPVGMPKDIFMDLKKVRVCGRPLKISLYDRSKPAPKNKGKRKSNTEKNRKPRRKA
jgi:ATP-dependent RNA helicase DeaD